MALEIIHYPHPTLRHVSRPLARVDADLKRMIAEMFALMYENEGVGLAANQVDLPYRVFVANPTGDSTQTEAEAVFINPILSGGKGQEEGDEGCLSIPGIHAPVVRNSRIKVEAYNLAGEHVVAEAEGFLARILQHEVDHLDGRLFIDRLTPAQFAEIRDDLAEFEFDFQSRRNTGDLPSDEKIAARIADLERLRT
ncbi:MAG: peptide deformylase [Pirellulales bacterium]|nr:peptide deformylase [Pirellulales bacterium]